MAPQRGRVFTGPVGVQAGNGPRAEAPGTASRDAGGKLSPWAVPLFVGERDVDLDEEPSPAGVVVRRAELEHER